MMRSGWEGRWPVGVLVLAGAAWVGVALRASAPRPPDPPPLKPRAGWERLLAGKPLDLNRATAEDLAALPGIGPVRARAILEERERRGGFRAVEDLLAVGGIGPQTLERLRPYLAAGRPDADEAEAGGGKNPH